MTTPTTADTPIARLQATLDALHPSARYVRVEAIDLRAAIEAEARASAEAVTVEGLANALHAVDDDVQFIRRDARNLPVLAGRILAALAAAPAEPPFVYGFDEEGDA